MSDATAWYIVKADSGVCHVVTAAVAEGGGYSATWGPFETQGEAIAKRVGLIRAGKCQPQ